MNTPGGIPVGNFVGNFEKMNRLILRPKCQICFTLSGSIAFGLQKNNAHRLPHLSTLPPFSIHSTPRHPITTTILPLFCLLFFIPSSYLPILPLSPIILVPYNLISKIISVHFTYYIPIIIYSYSYITQYNTAII